MKIKRYLIVTSAIILMIAVLLYFMIRLFGLSKTNDCYSLIDDIEFLYENNVVYSMSNSTMLSKYNQPSKEAHLKWVDERSQKIQAHRDKGEDFRYLLFQYDINKTMPDQNKMLESLETNAENIVRLKLTGKVIVPYDQNYIMYEAEVIDQYKGKVNSEDNKILLMHPISCELDNKRLRMDNMSVLLKMEQEYIMYLKRYYYYETQTDMAKHVYVTYSGGFSCYEVSDELQSRVITKGKQYPYDEIKDDQVFCYIPEDLELYNNNKKKILEKYQ